MSHDHRIRSGALVGAALLPVMLLFGAPSVAETAPSETGRVTIPVSEVWAVLSGGSLKGTIEGWARISGWTVVWDNPVDYRIRASATFHGGFEEAVARLVDAIHQGSPELTVTLYRGNRVLHVEDAARLRN
jgi:hypothetical protein